MLNLYTRTISVLLAWCIIIFESRGVAGKVSFNRVFNDFKTEFNVEVDLPQNIVDTVIDDVINDVIHFKQSNHFSWNDCSDDNALLKLTQLTLSPDPLDLPGDIKMSFTGYASKTIVAPIKVSLDVKKKEYFWVHVPCVDDVGSCTYDDICAKIDPSLCPQEFKEHHIPCQCPIVAGNYTLPPVSFPVSFSPSSLEKGDYKVEVKFKKDDNEIGCVHLEMELK